MHGEPLSFGRIRLLTCWFLLLSTSYAAAQTQPARPDSERAGQLNRQVGIGVMAGAAVGEFGDNVAGAGGFSGHVGVGLGESVFSLGGEVSLLWYGSESREAPLSSTIPDVLVTLTTDNTFLLVHGRLRAQRRQGRWRPYADALFGFNYISTDTSAHLGSTDTTDPIASTTNLEDVGLSYGGGAGVVIGFGSLPSSFGLDMSARFIAGSEVDYLREGAIQREGSEAILDISRSRADMVTFYVGASWIW